MYKSLTLSTCVYTYACVLSSQLLQKLLLNPINDSICIWTAYIVQQATGGHALACGYI